jgi:adenylate kinase
MKPTVFIVSGAPGCGKGTLIKSLFPQTDNTCQVISMSGALLKLRDDPELGPFVREPMDSGNLVPTEIAFPAFKQCFSETKKSCKSLVLDGVIRTKIQADLCLDLINHYGYSIQQIFLIVIYVSLHTCAVRMSRRGRSDDKNGGVIRRRFDVHRVFTSPAEEYLRATGMAMIPINGEQSPDLVEKEARRKMAVVCPLSGF